MVLRAGQGEKKRGDFLQFLLHTPTMHSRGVSTFRYRGTCIKVLLCNFYGTTVAMAHVTQYIEYKLTHRHAC